MADFAPKPVSSSQGTPSRDTTRDTLAGWAETAEQLRAIREAQKRAWGNVDCSTLGRYLADEVDDAERALVEAEMATHPELARLTDLVRDVFADFQPDEGSLAEVVAPAEPEATRPLPTPPVLVAQPEAPAPPTTVPDVVTRPNGDRHEPTTLPFAPREPRLGFFRRFRHELSLLAAACVLVAFAWTVLQYGAVPTPEMAGSNLASLATEKPGVTLPPDTVFLASLKPLEQLDQLDRRLARAQAGDAPVDPTEYEKLYYTQAKMGQLENHPRFAESLEHLGNCYMHQGQLARAESTLKQSYAIRSNWKPNSPETLRVAENLAGVYQLALNTPAESEGMFRGATIVPDRVPKIMAPASGGQYDPTPAEPRTLANPAPQPGTERGPAWHENLRDVRQRIIAQSADKVRRSVVPVLVQTLRNTSKPEERAGMMVALGRLGCAACDATPLLLDRLRQAKTDHEKVEAIRTLGRIGAGMPGVTEHLQETILKQPHLGTEAVQALLALGPPGHLALEQLGEREMDLRKEKQELLVANDKKEQVRRLQERINYLAQVRKLAGEPGAKTGVLDAACLFSPQVFHETNRRLHEMGQNAPRQVYIETLRQLPGEQDLSLSERARLVGTRGLYVLIASKSNTIRLQVGPDLRKAGFSEVRERELQVSLESLLKSNRHDAIPDAIVETLPSVEQP